MKRGHTNEDSILRKISESTVHSPRNRATRGSLHVGIGDDAALFRPRAGYETILTCDWFLEGTHFLRDMHPPDAVGWKCLARAVSDVAAMGGVPRCFLLSLALPSLLTGGWLDEFLRGLRRASRRLDCALAGGDTTRGEAVLINVTIIGEARRGQAVLRSGARPGDVLYLSGRIGEAEQGLQFLKHSRLPASKTNPLTRKHLYPEPRLALGQWLAAKGLASAMMDLSDGLSSDLPRLCGASRVGASVKTASLPLVRLPAARREDKVDPVQLALHGGDDYELLFTVPQRWVDRIPAAFRGVPLTPIGEITRTQEIVLIRPDGKVQPLQPGGWDPFRENM